MSTSANILTHQDQIIGYLRNEYDRLNTRLKRAGNKVKTQNRSSELYESARLKQEDKIAMLVYITVLFVALIIIHFLREILIFVPDTLFDLLVLAAIIYVGFSVYFKYSDMVRRDHMNHRRIATPAPRGSADGSDERGLGVDADFDRICIGQACCSDNTFWDGAYGKCVTKDVAISRGIDVKKKKEESNLFGL